MHTTTPTLKKLIIDQADLCVKCGMCSTHCPTYRISQNENESPRGRIALAQGLAQDTFKDNALVENHINSCLTCLACEKICPSQVSYSELIDNTRQLINQKKQYSNKFIRTISRLTMKQWQVLALLYRFSYRLYIPQLFSKLFFRCYFDYLRPVAKLRSTKLYSEQIELFTGCLSNIFDQQTLTSLTALLDACNIQSNISKNQTCCGALAKHKGFFTEAETCRLHNETVFANKSTPILFCTSACGAHLKRIAKKDTNSAFQNAQEAGHFLLNHKNFQQLKFKALNKRVLIHSPCSEKNDLKQSSSHVLLTKIPEIEIIYLPDTTPCCGAAGSNMLQDPDNARKIRQFTEDEIVKAAPDFIVSTNYTCAMHLAAGLRQKGLDIEVLHPLRLIHQQLLER